MRDSEMSGPAYYAICTTTLHSAKACIHTFLSPFRVNLAVHHHAEAEALVQSLLLSNTKFHYDYTSSSNYATNAATVVENLQTLLRVEIFICLPFIVSGSWFFCGAYPFTTSKPDFTLVLLMRRLQSHPRWPPQHATFAS